jgi:hypothetical protein
MRICDFPESEIRVGMRVKSLVSEQWGTVTSIDLNDDSFTTIKWDGPRFGTTDDFRPSGFYGNSCKCEVLLCFSCDKLPQIYVTGLCHKCHAVVSESDRDS